MGGLQPAPPIRGPAFVNGAFKNIRLADYIGKFVVFFFYPLDMRVLCPSEIIGFSNMEEEFRKIGCAVIGVLCGENISLSELSTMPIEEGVLAEVKIPFLANITRDIARAYGVFNEVNGIPYRALFIIDGKKDIRQITVNDFSVGCNVEEILCLVKAFQYSDMHGKVQNRKMGGLQLAPLFRGPAFVNGAFKDIRLADYIGKFVVFFFYPLDLSVLCPSEIIGFSNMEEEFRKIGCTVIGVLCGENISLSALSTMPLEEGGLAEVKIPFLADITGDIARAYGVFNEATGIPYRALFIIDGKQEIRHISVNDFTIGRNVEEILRLVKALRYADMHGKVCPANWKPENEDTIS